MSLLDGALRARGINQLQQGAEMRKTEKRPKMFCLDPLEGGGRRGQANALLVWVVWAVPCFLSPAWTVTSNISFHHLLSMPTRAPPSSWSHLGCRTRRFWPPELWSSVGCQQALLIAAWRGATALPSGLAQPLCLWPTNPSPGVTQELSCAVGAARRAAPMGTVGASAKHPQTQHSPACSTCRGV